MAPAPTIKLKAKSPQLWTLTLVFLDADFSILAIELTELDKDGTTVSFTCFFIF